MSADLHNDNVKQISERLTMNMASEQYMYEDRGKTFDPNLSSAAQYSPPPSVATTTSSQQSTAVAPFNTIASGYNEINSQHVGNVVSSNSEYSNNCISYSNVIYLPTVAANEQNDTIELVKNETESTINEANDSHSYKYIVSSDPRLLNTFIRSGEIDDGPHAPAGAYIQHQHEPSAHQMIVNVSGIPENNLVLSNSNIFASGNNQHIHPSSVHEQSAIHMSSEFSSEKSNVQEIVMQTPNGQLYRHVQNIYVNHADGSCSNEIIPTLLSEAVGLTDGDYSAAHEQYHQNQNIQTNSGLYSNYAENINLTGKVGSSNTQNDQLFYGNYKKTNEIDQNQIVNPNQYTIVEAIHHPSSNNHCELLTGNNASKDQQRILLESTMSPLLAAVNDITAREQQFQSYLANSKTDSSKSNQNVAYSSSGRYQSTSESMQYTTASNGSSAKSNQTSTESNKLSQHIFSNSIGSTLTDEYVDINEIQFITKNDKDNSKADIMRRSPRKKTTKKKEDELLIVDKHVESRCYASLPTSYLCIESQIDNTTKETDQIVYAKRDIPLRTKFGPFEGDIRSLSKDEFSKYRKTNTKYPLLFISHNSYLDTSNENTSNWMRFIRLAKQYQEQNLLLCDIDSKLYFRSCKFITPKQELRVGYSREYAEKYNLPILTPKIVDKQALKSSTKCDKQASSNESNKTESGTNHKANEANNHKVKIISPPAIVRTSAKPIDAGSPVKSKHRLNTGVIRMRKLALSKNSRTSGGPTVRYACCYCSKVFSKFLSYKKHTNAIHSVDIEHTRFTVDVEHKRFTIEDSNKQKNTEKTEEPNKENDENTKNAKKWFVCQTCQQYFSNAKKLEKHRSSSCDKKETLSVQCHICLKHVQTPSALSMHIKTHNSDSDSGIFKCPFCSESYQSTLAFKEHVGTHMKDGMYSCPHCSKEFEKYSSVRKHIQLNHSTVRFVCHECGKDFKSKYKLKEHSLKHSDVRQFLCDCGKQFKRKDKLREHILRIHAKVMSPRKAKKPKPIEDAESDKDEAKSDEMQPVDENDCSQQSNPVAITQSIEPIVDAQKTQKFQPKVPPSEYHRFIYKCNDCMLGFKRRGMLVNHMAKRHPDVRIDSVHELSLPILKTERCFYCQYCDKVYKSSSKRKAHILKYHPGQELPQSMRHRNEDNFEETNMPNATFTENVGSIATHAQQCPFCYRQYASRTRLLQHQRKQHSDQIQSYNQHTNNYFRRDDLMQEQPPDSYQFSDKGQMNQQTHDNYTMINYNDMQGHQRNHHFSGSEYESENKLLKLSSAAWEASMRDDFAFFHSDAASEKISDHSIVGGTIESSSSLSKVGVNMRVVSDEFADTSTSSNCDLPQLFEDIDCMALKPVQFTSSNENSSSGGVPQMR